MYVVNKTCGYFFKNFDIHRMNVKGGLLCCYIEKLIKKWLTFYIYLL